MKVENIIGRNGNRVKNQFVIRNGNVVTFQSYDSEIITINKDNKEIKIGANWDYSTTTGKYRNIFLEDEGFYDLSSKKDLEKAIENGKYNEYKIVMI